MAAYWDSDIHDAGLNLVKNNTSKLVICSQQPATYTEAASTYKLGEKSAPSISGPFAGDVSGRKITVAAISDGSVTTTGTATHFALIDDTNSRLFVAQALVASQSVTQGNPFTLTALDVEYPDPTS